MNTETEAGAAPVDTGADTGHQAAPDTSAPSPETSAPDTGGPDESGSRAETLFDAVEKVVPADTEPDVLADADKPVEQSEKTPDPDADEDDEDKDADPDAEAADAERDGANATPEEQAKREAREKEREESRATPEFTSADMKRLHPWARRKVRHMQDQLRTVQADAEVKQSLDGYLAQHHIDADQFNTLLTVGAAISRGDWQTARQVMEPFWNLAQQGTGSAIAPEVQKLVEQGHMTEQAARQMTQEQIRRRQLEHDRQRYEQTAVQQQEMERQRAFTQHVVTAVNDWEQQIRASDPDYDRKAEAVRDTLQGIKAQYGEPKSPQEAVEMAKAAYERVNGFAKRFAPAPKPTNARPSSVQQPSGANRNPTSLEDAMLAGLQNARR